MLRTNLSTRPFYNERSVHLILALVAVLVAALTIFNVGQVTVLSRRRVDLNAAAAAAEARSGTLHAEALKIRQSVNTTQLDEISAAAREAQTIVGRRLFSWTDLFNRFETTLPDNVRITSIRPRIEQGGAVTVTVGVVGRRVEDIDRFMENLEASGSFADVLSREENSNEEGLLVASLEGRYLPAPGGAPPVGKP